MKTYLNPMDRVKAKKVVEEVVEEKLTVKDLKAMAKEKGLTGYSRMKEDELKDLLGI